MYLEHFKLKQPPFSLTPNTRFYCNLPDYQAALNVLLFSLNSGEGFIKIIGEVGAGKTLLCRKLLNSLSDEFYTAYVPNPDLDPVDLRIAFARELGVYVPRELDQSELLQLILERLLELRERKRKVVLIIDEAQALPNNSLEALRLLTNLETESEKLLQIVLFAQPELEHRLKQHNFRQLNQRITFAHRLAALSKSDLGAYLHHRLAIAGHTESVLFPSGARKLLYKASGGVPRIINILCHKAMLFAYGKGDRYITRKAILAAIRDSEEIVKISRRRWSYLLGVLSGIAIFGLLIMLYYYWYMKQ